LPFYATDDYRLRDNGARLFVHEFMKLVNLKHSGQPTFIAIGILIVALWSGGNDWVLALEYHRDKIAAGELWRILTGHLVHTNTWHMLLNLTSLLFIGLLFGTLLSAKVWIAAFVFCSLAVSAAYWFIATQFIIYVGLSAALYGVIIIGALEDFNDNKLIAGSLLIIVTGRVIWQQFDGASDSLADMVDSRVAIESHLYGIVSGYVFSLILFLSGINSDKDVTDTELD